MGPGDLLPPEMGEYFGIPLFYLIIAVLSLGFVILRLTQKYGSLIKEMKSLDEIFLITIFGLVILFRLEWLHRMWIPLFTKTQLYLSFWIVPIFSILVTVLIIIVSIYDAEVVFHRKILGRKTKTKLTYKLFKRGKPKITPEEIDKNIRLTRFNTVIFGGFIIIVMILDVEVITSSVVIAGLSLLFAFTPIISTVVILYKKLTTWNEIT